MSSLPAIDGRPLFLVGFMGTGKSTVGALLATRLGREFVDLDDRIVADAGATIPEIFSSEGEAGFRKREAALLARACGEGAQVVSVGGGAPCYGDNLDKLLAAGAVVCLTATLDELMARVGNGEGRPLLAGLPPQMRRAAMDKLLETREPFYARAHLTVDTSARPPSKVVGEILRALAPTAEPAP